jgi:DnaJ-class molecular chaperone
MPQEPNLYKLLKVDPEADTQAIRLAYEYLAAKYDPENAETGNREIFTAISAAWRVLSDEQKREEYDQSIKDANAELEVALSAASASAEMLLKGGSALDGEMRASFLGRIRSGISKVAHLLGTTGRLPYQHNIPSSGNRCSFCDKTQEEVPKLIAGPGVNVCNACVGDLNGYLADPNYAGTIESKCSFCGKPAMTVKKLLSGKKPNTGPTPRVCDECVGLCNEILEEEMRT